MKNSKVLEMLKQNRIEELIAELQDEIFRESLTAKPNAKKRYTAMKRYLKTISEAGPILTKPCPIEFEGNKYNAFTNGFSLVLTTETCGEIEMCSEPERYPDVTRLIPSGGEEGKIDITYGILDDGQEISVWFNGEHRPLAIKNDIGTGIIMPVRYYLDEPDHVAIIDVTEGD